MLPCNYSLHSCLRDMKSLPGFRTPVSDIGECPIIDIRLYLIARPFYLSPHCKFNYVKLVASTISNVSPRYCNTVPGLTLQFIARFFAILFNPVVYWSTFSYSRMVIYYRKYSNIATTCTSSFQIRQTCIILLPLQVLNKRILR